MANSKKTKKSKNDVSNLVKDDNRTSKEGVNVSSWHFRFEYNVKFVVTVILFIMFLALSLFFFDNSVKTLDDEKINFTEKSNLDYKIKLKPNKFYEGDYLEKNMSYVASLIDTIYVDFNYDFDSDKSLYGDYKYKIVGVLSIINSDTNEIFFKKNYDLVSSKNLSVYNKKSINVNKIVDIDYDHYNSLANEFKSTYGVNASSKLSVYLEIDKDFNDDKMNTKELDSKSKMHVDIPLSEKAISIKFDYDDINNVGSITAINGTKSWNFTYLILGIVFLGLLILDYLYIVNRLVNFESKYSSYDKRLRKILREYDRMIVNSVTAPDFDKYELVKVDSFNELVDAKENFHKPIYYYDVISHQKSYFYVKDEKELVLYTMKNEDFENGDKRQ